MAEETIIMGILCMTMGDNTERQETITEGTNELLGTNLDAIGPDLEKLLSGNWKTKKIPYLWDGGTASRIIDKILEFNDI